MLHNIVQGLANAQIANIMTIVFVALMFISVIWGILRGFKKSVFYTIFYVIACAVLFVSLDKITTLALSFDLSSFGLVINGVKLVTLGDSVPELLRSILSQGNGADLSSMFVKGTESYVLVNTVLGSIVQFAVVLAFVLLFQTVYKLLVWILWLIIGKPFDRRKVRVRGKLIRKPKNATGGALVGFIPGLISVVMLFVPLSGVFSIAQSVTRVEVKNGVSFGDYLDEEDYYLLQQVLGQYEESVPGKLFNIKTSEDGRSLDLWLLDKCITVEVDGNKFNIREDIENMGEFASNMAATGLLDVMLDGEATTYDLVNTVNENEDKITKAFSSLGDIELIDLLLNTGIEYLDCSRIIDSTLELSSDSINYENLAKLDWSKELAQIGNIFISAVDILSLVPDSSLSSPTIELDKIDLDKLNNDDILENFVDELFKSNIINESATAGLAYVLGIDNVKEIVGEFDKEELKNVDLKADLLRVVEATKSILNIGFNNLKNVDLKELSNKSQDLKVIIDELLSMEIFALVEENVIDYAITNYVETNENIKKFVDVEELRELRLVDFKRELGAVIDTFGRLGEETKLFDLDDAENILMEKLNMDAFNSNALRIIVDHIDGSTTIQDFMDKILRGALVPSIFDEEKYNDLIAKENFKWSNELYVLVDLLKEIETNNSDFNIYVMATSEEKEITVGMLKGLYGVDENNEFIIDKSIFVEEMMVSIINKATEGNDFEGVFDDVDSLGVEIKVLTEMMIDAGIVEDRNDYVVDFANISNEFDGINLKMLRSICTHIGDSNILRSIINSKITDFKVNDKEVIDTSDWDANKYTEEFTVLYEVLEASGKIDEEEKTPFNELGNLFSDSIPLAMLEEVSNEVGHSEILQNTMKIALEEQFTNTDFDSWSNEDWTNETKSLYNIINDGELYTIDSEGDKVIDLNELTNIDEIKVVSICAFKDNIKNSTLIQNIMKDNLGSVMGEDYDYSSWNGNKWEDEMTALYNVSKTISSINDKGEEVISFDDFEDMSEIKMTTIGACRDNIKNSEMIQKLMKDNLGSVMGEDYDYSSWDGNKWEVEMTALYNISGTMATKNTNNEDVINFDDFEDMSEIKMTTIKECRNNIKNSEMIQKLMKDNLGSVMGEDYDYSSWDGDKWEDEMIALYNVSGTMATKNTNNEDVINFDDFEDMSEIKMTTIKECRNNIKNSEMIQKLMKDNLGSVMGEDYDYSSWDGDKWEDEMIALYNVSGTMSTKNTNNEDVINFDDFEDMSEIKMTTVEACKDNIEYSEMIQKLMKDNLDPVMGEGYDYSSWDGGKWRVEMTALYNVSGTMATKNTNNEDVINFDDFEDMSEIKMTTVAACRDNINGSEMIQKVMEDNLDPVMGKGYDYSSWTGDKWEDEMTALYNVSETMSTKNAKDEDVINFDDFEDMSEIKMTTVAACRDNINGSEMIQKVMEDNLDPVMGENYDYSSWTGDKWEDEMTALYNVSETMSTKNTNGEDVINFDDFEDMSEIKMTTIGACRDNIENSEMIQDLMSEELVVIMGDDYDFDAWTGDKWEDEMTALYNVSGTISTKNANDEDVINFDDFEDMSEIKMTTIGACRDNIENSEMIQDLMKDNLGSIMGDDYDYSSWDGNKWKVEMTSLYEISDTIKTKNTKNEYIIDLSSDLVGTEVKLITIEAVSNNSHSDIIRNCMQDTINDLLVIDNAPTLTCNPTNTYSGWDDAQWEYELYVLDVISTELSTDGVTIDTSNMADSLNSIEVSFFNELTNLVYGNKNGGSNKYNSYILQAQLTSAIESIMNTGFNSIDARYRFLHPTSVSSAVNYANNVPEYSDYSIAEDSSIGVWWSNELHALYNLLVAMYGENGTIAALDNIELNSVTIATLNAIRDNIRSSYVLQSSMRATIEDVMNGDLSNGSVSVTEMCTEFYSGETWKQEIAAIRNVAKTVSTYTGGGTLTYSYSLNSYNNFKYDGSNDGIMIENLDKYYEIDLNSIDLGNELKVETLYYATFYADRSNVIRSLLRVSIAEILGENNDDFVEYWLNYSNANGGIYDSFYNNRWTYEMEALFNVSSKLAKDGKIDLSGSMLNKIPVALFDEINGAFTSDNIIDGSNIISGLKDHGYIANYQKGSTEYEFASEIIRSLLKDSLASTDGIVNPSSWSDEQWAYEVHAISKVSSLLAVNNELDISTISFDGGIKAELLVIIPKIIDKATFLQHKLKPELENLVDSSMFTRSTIRADYGNSFELEVNYGDVDYAWRVELATVFGIITYDDGTLSSGLVDSNGIVAIVDVQEKLEQLNIDIIKIAAMLLKEKSNTLYTYNTSRIVRLNLIAPLEQMSKCTNVTYSGITPSDLPFITNVNAFPPFEWINDGSNTTDLEELYGFFELLGATNVTEAIEELRNISEFDPRIIQIISLAENSFFLTVVVNNQIHNP